MIESEERLPEEDLDDVESGKDVDGSLDENGTSTDEEALDDSKSQLGEPEEDAEEILQSRLEELQDAHLRLRAEYDNYRKRTLKEKSDLLKYAAEKVVVDFLEVLDDFDRALENIAKDATEEHSVFDGVSLIHDKMVSKLLAQGIKEMQVVGTPFEADIHDAVAMIPVEDPAQKGNIIDCVQKGYTLNDKVIRHPKVVVGQ